MPQQQQQHAMRIAFCHPDLGIGGAERLIVDAAAELAGRGHSVHIYTAHHDRRHCFEETVDGSFSVIIAGSWFPRHIWNHANALCTYIRCLLAALWLAFSSWRYGTQYDVVVVDQVSVVIPLLHALTSAKVLFYCHFPDLLQAQPRSILHRAYRSPLDWAEELSTGAADAIVVNSRYTRGIFRETFSRLLKRGVVPGVLYPTVQSVSDSDLAAARASWKSELPGNLTEFIGGRQIFLSINRFERKKKIELAIRAFHIFDESNLSAKRFRLVLAGGYDERLPQARKYMAELIDIITELQLHDKVWLLPSFTTPQRAHLLAASSAVIYTPPNEHFGIVPLEAMAHQCPVIACNSGGPCETIESGSTGFLCEPTAEAFAAAMSHCSEAEVTNKMGRMGRRRVQGAFSREKFGDQLERYLKDLL